MKKYRTSIGCFEIIEVDIERETDNSVWIKRSWNNKIERENKRRHFYNYHDSREAAKEFIINEIEIKLRNVETQFKKLKQDLQTAKNL